MEWWMIIQAAVTGINFKKITQILNFSRYYAFITRSYIILKDVQVGKKLTRWWTIIRIAVNSSDFKNIYANIAKDDLQYLVTPTS